MVGPVGPIGYPGEKGEKGLPGPVGKYGLTGEPGSSIKLNKLSVKHCPLISIYSTRQQLSMLLSMAVYELYKSTSCSGLAVASRHRQPQQDSRPLDPGDIAPRLLCDSLREPLHSNRKVCKKKKK